MKLVYLHTKTAQSTDSSLTDVVSRITKPTVALTKTCFTTFFFALVSVTVFFVFFLSSSFFCDYFLCTQHTGLICIPFIFSISHIFHCFSLMQILIHLVFILVFFLSLSVVCPQRALPT